MEIVATDLFGNPQPAAKPNLRNRSGAPASNPCVAAFGAGPDGKRCKHCKNLYAKQYGGKYFKCSLRKDTNGPATDHRANWPACAKFEQEQPEGGAQTNEGDLHRIKSQLEEGRRITVQSVLRSVGTQELRHYIPILRNRFGLSIGSQWLESRGKRFKEYFLNPPAA